MTYSEIEKLINEKIEQALAKHKRRAWIPAKFVIGPRYSIRFRRGPADEWSKFNPVLLGGEIGRESDTGHFKIGDGKASWNDLSYVEY